MNQQYEKYKVACETCHTEKIWWYRRITDDNGVFDSDWVRSLFDDSADVCENHIKKRIYVTECPEGCLMVFNEFNG